MLELKEPEITSNIETREDGAPEKDLRYERIFVLDDGKRIKAKRSGIYNLWSLFSEKGPLPGKLRGEFTTFSRVEDIVRVYATEMGKKIVEVIA